MEVGQYGQLHHDGGRQGLVHHFIGKPAIIGCPLSNTYSGCNNTIQGALGNLEQSTSFFLLFEGSLLPTPQHLRLIIQ